MSEHPGPAPAGWYPDPSGAPRHRYFDGELWTDDYYGDASATGVPEPAKSPVEYWREAMITKAFDFDGRARRAEYWWTTLLNLVALVALSLVAAIIGASAAFLVPGLVWLAALIPWLAAAVRRLHDTDKSGWFLLFYLVPFGNVIILIFLATDSRPGTNEWGRSPKYG